MLGEAIKVKSKMTGFHLDLLHRQAASVAGQMLELTREETLEVRTRDHKAKQLFVTSVAV